MQNISSGNYKFESKPNVLKELTEKWKSTLDVKIEEGDNAAEIIRQAIKERVMNKYLPLGANVPSYRDIATYLRLDKSIIERAINKLKVEDQLVITKFRIGTMIVPHLPNKRGPSKVKSKVMEKPAPTDMILFDQETLLQTDELNKSFNTKYNSALKKFGKLNTRERDEMSFPSLNTELATILAQSLKRSYTAAQVWCAEGYRALINLICFTLLPAKMCIVVATPVKRSVRETIEAVTDRVEYLLADQHGVSVEALEHLCQQKKVGIVYLSSRMPCPFNYGQVATRTARLLELQKLYGFVILEDDRYAGFYEHSTNLLMAQAAGTDAKIVYCCPLGLSDPRLNKINMVAAPEKIIKKLSVKATKTGLVLDAVTAYAVEEILKKKVLTKNEALVREAIKTINTLSRAVLEDDGLWQLAGYDNKKGWFFYLVPIKGSLPKNMYDLLANAGYAVVDMFIFENMPALQNGVLISMAAHLGNEEGAKTYLCSLCVFISKHISFNYLS